jgi:hypothetical protein
MLRRGSGGQVEIRDEVETKGGVEQLNDGLVSFFTHA